MAEQVHKHEDLQAPYRQPDGSFVLTGDELIGDAIAAFPKIAGVMLRYGLHCVGCHANAYDTIADGARLHGIPEPEVQEMLAEVNTTINKRIEVLELTERAIAKVKELRAKEEGKQNWPLRIAVLPGGCAGFSYDMDFDEQKEGDTLIERDGLQVVVDAESMPLLKGASIDYLDGLMGSGFKIENPNASRGCGCGKSFG